MIAMKANIVFHCSYKRKVATIENLLKPIDSYGVSLITRIINESRIIICYIDFRNLKLRNKYKTDLIPLPIPRIPITRWIFFGHMKTPHAADFVDINFFEHI